MGPSKHFNTRENVSVLRTVTFEPITQPHHWLLIPDSSACAKEETLDQATLLWDQQLIAHLIGSHGKCKCTKVNPKHWMKWIPYWMTADYGSEKCTMRQLSTLFKMQSVHIVDYEEGHLLILHASLLIWAGNWKSLRRTRKQKKDTNSRNSSSFHFQSTNHTPIYYRRRVLYSSEKNSRPPTLEQIKACIIHKRALWCLPERKR